MARKTPVELHRVALDLHRCGHRPETIADMLGLHPGALRNWLNNAHGNRAVLPQDTCPPANATRLSMPLDHRPPFASDR